MSLTSPEAKPSAEFIVGLQDEEDWDAAALEAAKLASQAMAARHMQKRGY